MTTKKKEVAVVGTPVLEVSGVSPQIAAEIRTVYNSTGGADLAAGVLAAAADPKSALHSCFEWDDTKAAETYRIQQADQLIRRVKVTIVPAGDQTPVQVRAYVSGRKLAEEGIAVADPIGKYLAIESVTGQSAYEVAMLAAITRDLKALQTKYRHVAEFTTLVHEILGQP